MKFSARHYTAIALVLKPYLDRSDLMDRTTILSLIETIADTFQYDNPRFNRDRFLRACGLVVTPKLTKGQ